MKIGTVDCAGSSVGNIGGHIPKAGLLGVPYIIQNAKHRERIVASDGRFFAALAEVVGESGDWRALGMTTAGTRSVYNSVRPVNTPDDLEGLKIRVMTSDTQVKSWKALGAVPTAMAFSEVYTGLMTKTIDAAENSPMFLWNMKHYEGRQVLLAHQPHGCHRHHHDEREDLSEAAAGSAEDRGGGGRDGHRGRPLLRPAGQRAVHAPGGRRRHRRQRGGYRPVRREDGRTCTTSSPRTSGAEDLLQLLREEAKAAM